MNDALNKLIEAVEAGLPSPTNWRDFAALPEGDPDNPAPILAHRAYYGSLGAAKALHEALLPGWHWNISKDGVARVVVPSPLRPTPLIGRSENPARAWLLAVLRAYASESAA